MTNKIFAGLLALLCLPVFSFAQSNGVCGTIHDTETAELMTARTRANRQIMDSNIAQERDDEVVYIPVKYHIFAKTDGVGLPKMSSILGLHCRLNEEYAEHEIQFYINDGFEFHYNDDFYEKPSDYPSYLNSVRSNNSVNVYIARTADIGPDDPDGGTTLGYYSPGDDWIVLRKSEADYNSETFPHEMGHFLSLDHPFNGWECQFWESWATDNPGECAPTISPPCFGPDIATERADGSNCANSGDFICDTPANYGFGFSSTGCAWTGTACDPTGAEVNPDPTNIMGYFSGCPDSDFTPEQVEMMLTDYNQNYRNYLRTDGGPSTTELVSATSELSYPEDSEVLDHYNVTVDWEDTPNAGKYIVQTALNSGFSLLAKETIVENGSSSVLLDYLDPGMTYYWRVTPYNEYASCVNWSDARVFTTGDGTTSVETVEGISEFTVNPNPTQAGNDLTVSINSDKAFKADLELISIEGKSVYTQSGLNFSVGNSSVKVNTQNLSAGLYFVTLRSATGVVNKRIVITE